MTLPRKSPWTEAALRAPSAGDTLFEHLSLLGTRADGAVEAAVRDVQSEREALLAGYIAWVAMCDPQSQLLHLDVLQAKFGKWVRVPIEVWPEAELWDGDRLLAKVRDVKLYLEPL